MAAHNIYENIEDLEYLASIASSEFQFAPGIESHGLATITEQTSELIDTGYHSGSVGSPNSSGSPTYASDDGCHDQSQYYQHTPVLAVPPTPDAVQPSSQVFFPAHFSPPNTFYSPYQQSWNYGMAEYISPAVPAPSPSFAPFALAPVEKASTLKKRRASRSKCPCAKCCQAKASGKPSPVSHSCVVLGCPKTYTRPAHLRAHLKSHQNDQTLKCQLCRKTVMSADLLVSHMFQHAQVMKNTLK